MKISLATFALIILCSSSAFAQFPQGSLIHLQGDKGVIVAGGKVQQWQDANDPSRKFIPPASGNEPTTLTAPINGHATVTFNGFTNYLEGPSVFPVSHDYTLCAVIRINNFGLSNNIVSGNTHALFFSGSVPYFLHGNFNTIAGAGFGLNQTPSLIVARFDQSRQVASFSINGYQGDSAFVGTNTDSVIYIGAYARQSFLGADVAEIYIFPRYLSDSERVHLQDSLLRKYNIAGPQPFDSTFVSVPHSLQLYPRETDDSATVEIKGMFRAKGFDSVYMKVLKNSLAIASSSRPLSYGVEGAPFSFSQKIHCELSEYSFILGVRSAGKDSILRRADSVVCGDVYFVSGQSNSIGGGDSYANEFCRTFGSNASSSRSDTLWELATASGYGGGANVGAFGMRIQADFAEKMKIPTAIISGGVGGTPIEQHIPNLSDPMNLQTFYGSMLYRSTKSNLALYAKAIFWYQGESNTIANYFDNFKRLHDGWLLDYPNAEKMYVVQVRPGCNAGTASELRDLLRRLPDYFPEVVSHSTMGLPGHDGCHFFLEDLKGYHDLGDQLYALLLRDIYHSTDTIGIGSPNIEKAYYTSADHKTIALVFRTGGSALVIPKDTTASGIRASIKDYFYVGSDTGLVSSITAKGDTVFLQLAFGTNARMISYLPDQNYNGTTVNYEGPWLANSRGIGAFSF
ncbi:MAG: sialate O-acetylesterase, partial [Ignavibacteriota bacterium]